MIGAGMVGREACVTEGALGSSGQADYLLGNRGIKAHAECRRAAEESERLIVALTPGESREQRRGLSRLRLPRRRSTRCRRSRTPE